MGEKPQSYIRNVTCAKFDLPSLKSAYEVLEFFDNLESSSFEKETSHLYIHKDRLDKKKLFDRIYVELVRLNFQNFASLVTCPSDQLQILFPIQAREDQPMSSRSIASLVLRYLGYNILDLFKMDVAKSLCYLFIDAIRTIVD